MPAETGFQNLMHWCRDKYKFSKNEAGNLFEVLYCCTHHFTLFPNGGEEGRKEPIT